MNFYRANFPESLFIPANQSGFNKIVEEGYNIASSLKLEVIGLAYNCQDTLATNILRCKRLGSYFKSFSITILENNSTDNTAHILKNNNVEFIIEKRSKPYFSEESPERFSYLAELRNNLLDTIRSKPFSYFMVYDFDIQGGFSYDGVMSSIKYGFEATASNGLIYNPNRKMYDWLAYREKPGEYSPKNGELSFRKGTKPFKINSAFGGLGLYKKSCLRNKYNDNYGCEHVGFHQGLDLYFNPSQTVLYSENSFTI